MGVWSEITTFITAMGVAAAVCYILGFIFIVIEMFTPGFAVPGITGIVLLLMGIVLSANSFYQGLVVFLIILMVLTILAIIVMRSASKGLIFKSKLVLKNAETSEEGFISNKDMNYFVGKKGVAITPLRPAGTCDFDGVRLAVVTDGAFIDKDSNVKIEKVEGYRIVVVKEN